jgi:hypothetical protein
MLHFFNSVGQVEGDGVRKIQPLIDVMPNERKAIISGTFVVVKV